MSTLALRLRVGWLLGVLGILVSTMLPIPLHVAKTLFFVGLAGFALFILDMIVSSVIELTINRGKGA